MAGTNWKPSIVDNGIGVQPLPTALRPQQSADPAPSITINYLRFRVIGKLSVAGCRPHGAPSKIIGHNVYNTVSEKIGTISELIVDESGKLNAVVVGAGGFLGIGEQ
jgi:hypothetical protein